MSTRLPVVVPVRLKGGMIKAFSNLAGRPWSFLLDSGDGGSKYGRYSFAGFNPVHTFSASGGFITIDGHTVIDNPADAVRKFTDLTEGIPAHDPYLPFAGGMVGFVSFEWGNGCENTAASSGLPDLSFGLYDTILTFDHLEEAAWISSFGMKEDGSPDEALAESRAERFLRMLDTEPKCPPAYAKCPYPPLFGNHPIVSSMTKEGFISAVNILKGIEHLPLFARQFMSPTHKTPWQMYLDLRSENPSPYAAYLNCRDFHILSASRTCLMKIKGDQILSMPTKGSAPKEKKTEDDNKRINELSYSGEIQSSHRHTVANIMRNLSGVCDKDSINTQNVAHVESDAKTYYLVSNVSGTRHKGARPLDCLLSILPSFSEGDIAPLLSRLEKSPRSVYTGAIGYIGCNGTAEFNSAFRTMILKDTISYLHAGTEVGLSTDPEEAFFNTGRAAGRIFELVR